jgi:hypothetical protein
MNVGVEVAYRLSAEFTLSCMNRSRVVVPHSEPGRTHCPLCQRCAKYDEFALWILIVVGWQPVGGQPGMAWQTALMFASLAATGSQHKTG